MVAAWLIERLRTQLQQEHWAAQLEAGRRQREHLAGLRQGLRQVRQMRVEAGAQLARLQLENLELRKAAPAALRAQALALQPGSRSPAARPPRELGG
jgi:hypothetical protein